jgi:hypothetical protein
MKCDVAIDYASVAWLFLGSGIATCEQYNKVEGADQGRGRCVFDHVSLVL